MPDINQFTGMSDNALSERLQRLIRDWNSIRNGDGHGGSPGEGTLEMITDIEYELERRKCLKVSK